MARSSRGDSGRTNRAAEAHADEFRRRSLSKAISLQARLAASLVAGALTAGAIHVTVRLSQRLGWLATDTVAASLGLRIALPAAAFVAVFALVFWRSGKYAEPPQISAKMTDAQIAKALKRIR